MTGQSDHRCVRQVSGALEQPTSALAVDTDHASLEHFVRPLLPPQGKMNTCVAYAIASAIMACERRADYRVVTPSRMFIYYRARVRVPGGGTPEVPPTDDAGCDLPLALDACTMDGYCPESAWPYVVDNLNRPPPPGAVNQAAGYGVIDWEPVNGLDKIKGWISQEVPVIAKLNFEPSFVAAKPADATIQEPANPANLTEEHVVLIVAFDDAKQQLTILESLYDAYFFISYKYLDLIPNGGGFFVIHEVAQPGVGLTELNAARDKVKARDEVFVRAIALLDPPAA